MAEKKPDQTPAQTAEQPPVKKAPRKRPSRKKQPAVEILPDKQGQQEQQPEIEHSVAPEHALMPIEQDGYNEIVKKVENSITQVFTDAQRALLINETPRYKIKSRQGKGGQVFDYVDVGYVIEQLNILTGFRWNFEHLTDATNPEYMRMALELKQFVVRGRLTMVGNKGENIYKDDVGNQDIKEKRAGGWLDVGNDMKGAWSDCIKRCSRQFGIALDVYSGAVKRRQDQEHPEAPITDSQRRRLEVLANEAKIGHPGLKQMIAAMFDYSSTLQIQRRHYEQIQAELENKKDVISTEKIPEEIKKGFDILGTPPAKQQALYKAYEKQGKLDELKSKISNKVDSKNTKDEEKKTE